ncbi:MAG: DUF4149 domain-containing protein [Candidatus Competibacteraceae bacterium]|nr:DUF4149 domain-containing protein [Candidatus Competibacteraceae bacterium]
MTFSRNLGERILTVIWIGSLWTIGYMVAPTLFAVLDDRTLAGLVAGRLFTIGAYLGLLCGGLLLVMELASRRSRWRLALLGFMLMLIAVGQFGLQPLMADLKAQGLAEEAAFARLHGISAGLYLLTSLLGLVWVAFPRA